MLNYFALRYRTTAANMCHFFCRNVRNVRPFISQTKRSKEVNTFFVSIRVFFHLHWRLTGQQGNVGTIFYSTLQLPPARKHLGIYLQLCMWDAYHILLIAPLLSTRLLLDEFYHLIELLFHWLMMWYHFLFVYLMIWY